MYKVYQIIDGWSQSQLHLVGYTLNKLQAHDRTTLTKTGKQSFTSKVDFRITNSSMGHRTVGRTWITWRKPHADSTKTSQTPTKYFKMVLENILLPGCSKAQY